MAHHPSVANGTPMSRCYKHETMDIDFAKRNFIYKDGEVIAICGSSLNVSEGGGYLHVRFKGKKAAYHRLVFWLLYGYNPECIDHIDRNRLNNNPSNLRESTISQNNKNSTIKSNNTSGYKGVRWVSSCNKWTARIMSDGVRITIGYYDSAKEAAINYDKKCVELHGEFAATNKDAGRY